MNILRRILFLALVLAVAVTVFQNQHNLGMSLEFSFLHWTFSMVLGFWILLAFAVGVALFALIDAWRGMLLRLEIRRKDHEITRLKQLLSDLGGGRDLSSGTHGSTSHTSGHSAGHGAGHSDAG
jgi:uncharacterized integral membrane protein